MSKELEKLKTERERLRKEIKGKHVSSWKFWQYRRDNELCRKLSRICEINDIFYGVRLQKNSHTVQDKNNPKVTT